MYHIPHDSGAPHYNYNGYRENRRSVPSYALVPHNSSSNRRAQYATTRYHTEPTRYHSETRYHTGPTRYHSDSRVYRDSRDHVDTYQEQRYVIPYNNNTHAQYRTSYPQVNRHHDNQLVPTRYSQYSSGHTPRSYKSRRQTVGQPIPVCACAIM